MAFPKHKRTYGAKKATKKLHCRAHKDKKSDLKCFLQRKERSRTVFMEKKKKYRCFFTNTALLRCIFATQKVSTDVFLQKTLLKCKMETRKMNRGCDVQDYLYLRCNSFFGHWTHAFVFRKVLDYMLLYRFKYTIRFR